MGEHALLARVLALLPRAPSSVLVGPGDDAAVVAVARNERLVLTTDCVVEDVHFTRAYSTPADIGHRVLAANLSDLAAMGAVPRWALLSLMVPGQWLVADVEALVGGVAALARLHSIAIVGGNITRSPGPLVVDIAATGEARPRRWLTRSDARPGDELWISGSIGAAAAGLEMLRAGGSESADPALADRMACIERYRRPAPRVRLGLAVARARAARAAIDLSDGLADAVRQLAGASGCGASIDAAVLPVHAGARAWWTAQGASVVDRALAGGDDYELLFAVPPRWGGRLRAARRHVIDPTLTKIGVLTKAAERYDLKVDGRIETLPFGFEHFGH